MQRFGRLCLLLGALVSTVALGQLTVPRIVQLPRSDFTWNWGRSPGVDERVRAEFDIEGREERFLCTLTGAFRLASRMRDFSNLRQFEQSLNNSLYFIQDSTEVLNAYYRANELQWATLDCQIPERTEDEEKTQDRVDRALERAQRQRERRREREDD
ncbi:MAG TPA: hypothetical protein VIV64_09825 [Gammaproteobacteria bacterium]